MALTTEKRLQHRGASAWMREEPIADLAEAERQRGRFGATDKARARNAGLFEELIIRRSVVRVHSPPLDSK
jgi:hypothetical protein